MQPERFINSSPPSPPPPLFDECILPETQFIMFSLSVIYIIMTPLFVFVLILGYQKWQKERFGAFLTSLSHMDVFTYNVVVLDLICSAGIFLFFLGCITNTEHVRKVGICSFGIFTPGQTLFHLVTCVERYLAVVHPVIYRSLRGSCGVRIRNVIVGCIWMISSVVMVIVTWCNVPFVLITGLLLSFTSIAFVFCSFSVLCALIRPGPGEGGGDRERDQSKQRAFHTMMIITGILSIRFLSNLISSIVQYFYEPLSYLYCLVGWSSVWFFVPSSLVLPLFFLQREGKLPGCGPKSNESA